jgi:hypothetical protein
MHGRRPQKQLNPRPYRSPGYRLDKQGGAHWDERPQAPTAATDRFALAVADPVKRCCVIASSGFVGSLLNERNHPINQSIRMSDREHMASSLDDPEFGISRSLVEPVSHA